MNLDWRVALAVKKYANNIKFIEKLILIVFEYRRMYTLIKIKIILN